MLVVARHQDTPRFSHTAPADLFGSLQIGDPVVWGTSVYPSPHAIGKSAHFPLQVCFRIDPGPQGTFFCEHFVENARFFLARGVPGNTRQVAESGTRLERVLRLLLFRGAASARGIASSSRPRAVRRDLL